MCLKLSYCTYIILRMPLRWPVRFCIRPSLVHTCCSMSLHCIHTPVSLPHRCSQTVYRTATLCTIPAHHTCSQDHRLEYTELQPADFLAARFDQLWQYQLGTWVVLLSERKYGFKYELDELRLCTWVCKLFTVKYWIKFFQYCDASQPEH